MWGGRLGGVEDTPRWIVASGLDGPGVHRRFLGCDLGLVYNEPVLLIYIVGDRGLVST